MGKELGKLSKDIRRLRSATPRILKAAMSTLQTEIVERIHSKGQDAKGAKIGTYSTKPTSIAKKNQVRNTGQTFFQGGYREYKYRIGQDASKVTLEHTGQMRKDFSVIPLGRAKAGLGFKNPVNNQKSEWMEDKYNKNVYAPSKKENDTVIKVFNREAQRIIK